MTDAEVIAFQAKKILEQEIKLQEHIQAAHDIRMKIYCIGGPLNDNLLKYTNNQLAIFAHIINLLVD